MFRKLTAFASIFLSTAIIQAQEAIPTPQEKPKTSQQKNASQQTPSAATSIPTQPLAGFGIEDGTPIKLRLTRNLSSGTDKKGDTVDFEVLEDLSVQGVIVVPRGG